MTLKEIHAFINFVSDKEQGGYCNPNEIDQALAAGSRWLFNEFYSQYAVNQNAHDALAPFKAQADFETDETGNFALSSDTGYQHLLGLDVIEAHPFYGNIPHKVKIVNEDEYAERKASVIRRPTISNPFGRITGVGQFELCPHQTLAGTIRYLKAPVTPRLQYVQEGRSFEIDESASVNLEWSDVYQNKVVFKALEILGINLDNEKLTSYGDALTKSNI